ncbi:hypothetical protein, partial [Tsukamurella tyrosinosolvens]|uniref:hypothetical protein n=1 Tax=Tsukamurella tyrosinosolvens TaxID=57704 RepID=UPI000B1D6DB7
TGRGAEVGSALAAGAGYLIPVAVIVLVGLASRAATVRPARLGWVVLAWAGIVGLLAETLRPPRPSRRGATWPPGDRAGATHATGPGCVNITRSRGLPYSRWATAVRRRPPPQS